MKHPIALCLLCFVTAAALGGGYHDDVEISAPWVFAGYGITAPGLNYDDYRNIDARGKVAVVFGHEPQANDR